MIFKNKWGSSLLALGFLIAAAFPQSTTIAVQAELEHPLTVLNYNVWNSFNHNKKYSETIQWVNRLEPDIAAWQELVGWDEAKLIASAKDWNHPYAAALKDGGYNIGLTSKYPIEVIQRRTENYHHGFLHCRTAGIEVIVCHLWPGKRREQVQEATQIRDLVIKLEGEGRQVLLMGDFNAHVESDANWLNQQTELINRRFVGDEKKAPEDRFIHNGQYNFDVMNVILQAPLADLVLDHFTESTKNMSVQTQDSIRQLGSFPSRILQHAQTPEQQNGFLERIDFIFASKGLAQQCNSAHIRHDEITNTLSDHYPVVAQFGIRTTDVYLLAGQSNMQGIGKLEKLTRDRSLAVVEMTKDGVHDFRRKSSLVSSEENSSTSLVRLATGEIPGIKFFTGNRLEDLIVGETKTSSRKNDFGPEVGFAWQLSVKHAPKQTDQIAIVKFHASGQPLHHGWDGNQWKGTDHEAGRRNFYPGVDPDDPNQGKHYRAMHLHFRKALNELERQGIRYRLAGFVWMQGEQDSKNLESANSYATSLKRLKHRLEQDLNQGKSIPMVFGQVLPHTPALDRFVARDIIRQRMSEADQDSEHPNAISDCKMLSTDNFPLLPDHVHYNAEGQWKLGVAFANMLLRLSQN